MSRDLGRPRGERVPQCDLGAAARRLDRAAHVHLGRAPRLDAALVALRRLARLHVQPRRRAAAAYFYVIPAAGGEGRGSRPTSRQGVEDVVWSPDSTRIAFTMRDRDAAYEEEDDKKRAPRRFTFSRQELDSVGWTGARRKHLYVVDIDGGEPVCRSRTGDFEDELPAPTSGPIAPLVFYRSAERELGHRADHPGVRRSRPTWGAGTAHRRRRARYGRTPRSADGAKIRIGVTASRTVNPPMASNCRSPSWASTARNTRSPRPRSTASAAEPIGGSRSGCGSSSMIEDGGNVHLYAVAADAVD